MTQIPPKAFPNRAILVAAILLATLSGCGPDIKNKDPKVRIAAVQKLTHQKRLESVVFEDSDELVREAAVLQLTDQAILARIATEHPVAEVRFTAVARLTDSATLEKIIKNEKEGILLRQFANQRFEAVTGTSKYSFH